MPELKLEYVFLGGGGGGDLLDFSKPCFVTLSVDACFVMVLGGFSSTGLAGFSITGLGSFSATFLAGLSE